MSKDKTNNAAQGDGSLTPETPLVVLPLGGVDETDSAGTAITAEAVPPVAEPASPEELQALQAKAAKAEEYWQRVLRISADLENFKKRAARERQEAVRFANAALLEKLVPVLDHFDMALAAASSSQTQSVESFKTGVNLIQTQLRNVLTEAGLEPIDATLQPFDPNWHEAVSQQESTEVEEGRVLQQLRKGYKLRERLLRPATVIVAKKPAS